MSLSQYSQYFRQDTPEEIARRWKMNLAPGRISLSSVRMYRAQLERIFRRQKNIRALLLGATPELRDLCLSQKWELTSVDVNLNMILAMNLLMREDSPREIIVRGDWLTVPLEKHHFDCILGDYALNMVSPQKLHALFLKLRALLKPGGVFLQQAGIIDYPILPQSFREIIARYSAKKKINPSDLRWDLLMSTWQRNTRKFYYEQYSENIGWFVPLLNNWHRQGKLSKNGLEGLLVYRGSKKEAFLFLKSDFENPLKRHFAIITKIKGKQSGCYFYIARAKRS